MSQRKRWISLIVGMVLLVLILACNFVPSTPSQATQAPSISGENPYLEVKRVTLEEAKAAFDAGTAIFVDVRSQAAYQQAHIPGALSIPGAELKSRMNELDPEQWIITYCT